jgi:small neutral amino acid transporter SnatA (MarC family)
MKFRIPPKYNVLIGIIFFIMAGMSFFGNPGPNLALPGGTIGPVPSHTQSVIGGIVLFIMGIVCLLPSKIKRATDEKAAGTNSADS